MVCSPSDLVAWGSLNFKAQVAVQRMSLHRVVTSQGSGCGTRYSKCAGCSHSTGKQTRRAQAQQDTGRSGSTGRWRTVTSRCRNHSTGAGHCRVQSLPRQRGNAECKAQVTPQQGSGHSVRHRWLLAGPLHPRTGRFHLWVACRSRVLVGLQDDWWPDLGCRRLAARLAAHGGPCRWPGAAGLG